MRPPAGIPPEVEEFRDRHWYREPTRQVETTVAAERFIEQVGFAACLTDSRRPGPSLYVAVCGRRDAVLPRHVQKDPESSLTWRLKDDLLKRGRVYYAKLAGGKGVFLAPRMIPYFHAVWGVRRSQEFTYIWTLAVGRFPDHLLRRVKREAAVTEIARCFLAGAGMTFPGEMARVTGLDRPEGGRGNRALVAEGFATMPARGVYRLAAAAAFDEPPLPTVNEPALHRSIEIG
jgi:hypothetical protein